MKSIFVSIIDILGIFIPGFLLLLGVALFPFALGYSVQLDSICPKLGEVSRANTVAIGIILAIISYVFGFIIRLYSTTIIHFLTKRWWAEKLESRTQLLNDVIENCLKYPELCSALKKISENSRNDRTSSSAYAPYFS